MSVDDIGCGGSRQQETYRSGVWSIERNKIRSSLSNETGDESLPSGITNCLGQSRGRNGNAQAEFFRARYESKRPAIFSIQGNQATGIKSNAVQAALPVLGCFLGCRGARSPSAHWRSFLVSGPPVCSMASSKRSFHPAAS
jgi:hypothetical protein